MWDVAPLSVMVMGLLGILVVAFAMLRIVLLERKVARPTVVPAYVAPPETFTGVSAAA
jgi:hypothetical protein